MNIGIPVERKQGEGRVALTPDAVAEIVRVGATVYVESSAGVKSGFSDAQYKKAGALIKKTQKQLYEKAMLIVKVKEPLEEELAYFRAEHILFCYLHLAANKHLIKAFKSIGNTAIAFESVEAAGEYPLLAPMSDIAGKVAVQLGMHYLSTAQGGSGVLLGGGMGGRRADVVVLGGGVAGLSAATLAADVGGQVTVFDIKTAVLQKANLIGANVTGLYSQTQLVEEAVLQADLVVGAVLVPNKRPPIIVSKATLRKMKAGSVVVDIAIDQGGCIEGIKPTTHEQPCYQKHGVQMLAVTNLPGAVPRTATQCLSGAVLPYVLSIVETYLASTRSETDLSMSAALLDIDGFSEAVCSKSEQII